MRTPFSHVASGAPHALAPCLLAIFKNRSREPHLVRLGIDEVTNVQGGQNFYLATLWLHQSIANLAMAA
jgi:hypothetical protein